VIGFLLCTQTVKVLALLEAGLEPLVQSGQECITDMQNCQAQSVSLENRVGDRVSRILEKKMLETGLGCKINLGVFLFILWYQAQPALQCSTIAQCK
jgi:hypothetical protein